MLDWDNSTGKFFNEFSISRIRLFFQFKRIICHEPNEIKTNIKKITKTENGVNPLCFNQKTLLGCDVWEHSYYLDFRNKRPVYIMNFLDKLVNWEFVASQL